MKSEGVKDIVKWLDKKIKKAHKAVKLAEQEFADYKKNKPFFCDSSDYHENEVTLAKEKLSTLVEIKIGTEKYMKKLKHEGK